MQLIIICGPPASGKMTVGQELQKLTGFKLLYNHMSLELVNQFYDFGTPHFNALDKEIRFAIFRSIATSDIDGLIFTGVWAFNEKADEEYFDQVIATFAPRNPKVCIVELECTLEERLRRNRHPHRLAHKPSKRDIEASDKRIIKANQTYRANTLEGEFPDKSIFKIRNTNIPAEDAAGLIVEKFGIPKV